MIIIIICDIYITPYSARSCSNALYDIIFYTHTQLVLIIQDFQKIYILLELLVIKGR